MMHKHPIEQVFVKISENLKHVFRPWEFQFDFAAKIIIKLQKITTGSLNRPNERTLTSEYIFSRLRSNKLVS